MKEWLPNSHQGAKTSPQKRKKESTEKTFEMRQITRV